MSGWFPRYSPAGVLTNEWPGHWRAQWLREGAEIYDNGRVLVIGGKPTEFPTCNELSAAGGRWAAFRTDPPRVYTSDGQTILGAGCPAITATDFAYVDDRQADTKNLVLNGAVVGRGAITDVRLSRQALVWSDGGRTYGIIPGKYPFGVPLQVAPVEFRPIPIDTPDGPWVLNHTPTGIILRPFGINYGYRFDNGGQTYYPDAVCLNNVIYVAFSDEHGELTQMQFPLTAPRVDLSLPAADKQPGPINTTPVKDTPVMPIAPNRLDVVNAVIAAHPEINRLADGPFAPNRGGITQAVAQTLGFPFGRKSRDRSPTNLSDDALCYRLSDSRFEIYDILSGGDGSGQWSYAGTFADGENGYFSTVSGTPTPVPVPTPTPAPTVDLAPLLARLAVLEGQIKNLQHAEADALDQIHQLDATRVKLDQLPDFSKFAKKGDRVEVSGRISGFGVNRWGGIISL